MVDFFVGIDGGGTSCRAAVADASGRVAGLGRGGAANILTDPNDAIASIMAATSQAFAGAGLSDSHFSSSCALMGLAGSNVGDLARYVTGRLPFARAEIVSDGLIALQGALGNEDGGIAILGTGSVFLARSGGDVRSIGGWGFQAGDQGGGAPLGRALLQEVLLAYDGIHERSALSDATLSEFGGDPRAIVEFARLSKPSDFARFAPRVFDAASDGDWLGVRLVSAAAASVDETLDALRRPGCDRLCLLGGLAGLYAPWLAERHRATIGPPAGDALAGAVALAIGAFTATGGPMS